VSLLKILLTNHCIYDCQYCINRVSSDVPRARFTVEEVVQLTLDFYRRNYIEGLFLSSGIVTSPDETMAQLAEVARRLREEHYFAGYIHLKAVAGASTDALAAAGRHADRLSANIELPTDPDLKKLAPEKTLKQAEDAMSSIKAGIENATQKPASTMPDTPRVVTTHPRSRFIVSPPRIRPRNFSPSLGRSTSGVSGGISGGISGGVSGGGGPRFAPAGQSTQMIVGATPTPDAEVLRTADRLYKGYRLRRVYYTAYSPIPKASHHLPTHRPPLIREHRLYQADWLLRFYGFNVDELVHGKDRNLDLEVDPKMAWALAHRDLFPLDLNKDARELLLRVPGMGVRTVNRLLAMRRHRRIRRADLKAIRVPKRAMPFVVTDDDLCDTAHLDRESLRHRIVAPTAQLNLFQAARSAATGEV
jgi:putative DNA modification/repair radical SAM protein